jgi:hypothetical protein
MGAQRSSLSKLQRDRDKQAKAAVKRERRQNRDSVPESEDGADAAAAVTDESDAAEILVQVEQLHREFDAHVIDFETFETRKADLMSRIQV